MLQKTATMPSLIAFDLDDTLYKERDYVVSGRRAVAAALAPVAGVDAGILLEVMNNSDDAFETLHAALAGTPAAGVGIAEMVAIYRQHRPDIALTTGVARIYCNGYFPGAFVLQYIMSRWSLTQSGITLFTNAYLV